MIHLLKIRRSLYRVYLRWFKDFISRLCWRCIKSISLDELTLISGRICKVAPQCWAWGHSWLSLLGRLLWLYPGHGYNFSLIFFLSMIATRSIWLKMRQPDQYPQCTRDLHNYWWAFRYRHQNLLQQFVFSQDLNTCYWANPNSRFVQWLNWVAI